MLVLPQDVVDRLGLRTRREVLVAYANEYRETRQVAGPVTVLGLRQQDAENDSEADAPSNYIHPRLVAVEVTAASRPVIVACCGGSHGEVYDPAEIGLGLGQLPDGQRPCEGACGCAGHPEQRAL